MAIIVANLIIMSEKPNQITSKFGFLTSWRCASAMVPGFGSAQEGGRRDVLRLGSFRAPGCRRDAMGVVVHPQRDNAASSPVWPHGDGADIWKVLHLVDGVLGTKNLRPFIGSEA